MRWIDNLEDAAAERLAEPVHRYVRQGSAGERSVAEAEAAWSALRIRPRVLVDVSTVRTETTVLGTSVAAPILVAPTTVQRQADPDGEAAMARGTLAAGSLLCVSSNAGTPFAAIGETGAPWWVQAYVLRDRGATAAYLQRAVEGGARAVVLTADTAVVGRKEDPEGQPTVWDVTPAEQLRANVDPDLPDDAYDKAADLTPDAIGWLAEVTGLPVVVKGVLRGDDARRCVEAGAAGIVVSNHGGRQLDGAIATARALPDVVDAVAGSAAEVYVDGGIRRGEHVLSALALGARGVLLGRPAVWALAVAGADGVRRLLTELTDELRHAMQLAGCPDLGAIGSDLVATARS
ncbi:MAG TPA: alpha-hydroxy acid oxidase [Nocardioidaceae bacterium]|nr:alpha-hydroxy acid oxidase [Nocardioidaceae bacterium]